MAQFSLSWDAYKQNICSGLTALQQNGEFVDMTIAADGHLVKVHQMVLSLVSPYIKELITTAHGSHPIIFLNKVSYPTLCAILEYIYTGEVLIAKENLSDLVEAARELHIKGLEDMKLELSSPELISQALQAKSNKGQPLSETGFFKSSQNEETNSDFTVTRSKEDQKVQEVYLHHDDVNDNTYDEAMDTDHDDRNSKTGTSKVNEARIQYTISNQGALQMVLNRCVYYLRYTSRKGPSGHRQWRCIDYVRSAVKCPATVITKDDVVIKRRKGPSGHRQWRCIDFVRTGVKCPATVVTEDDVVTKRFSAHNHPFHDKQILKKVRDNAIYNAINEAEALGNTKRLERQSRGTPSKNDKDVNDTE